MANPFPGDLVFFYLERRRHNQTAKSIAEWIKKSFALGLIAGALLTVLVYEFGTEKPKKRHSTVPPRQEVVHAPANSASDTTIFISSVPPVADVYMDGALIGKTNIKALPVQSGERVMRLVKGKREFSEVMTFTTGTNPARHIKH